MTDEWWQFLVKLVITQESKNLIVDAFFEIKLG